MLMIPGYSAYDFLVLSDEAEFIYKYDEYYHLEDEDGIMYNNPNINIERSNVDIEILLSDKDKKHANLRESKMVFEL